MHLLTRFFSQKNFLDAFISGKLYMNTLDYFWNNGFEEQKDIFEGVVCTVPVKDFNGFPMDFQAAQASDYHFRAEGYKFCNVLCFYKIDFILERGLLRYDLNDDMSKFGEYVAIITNEAEFLRRIEAAAKKSNYEVLCGDIHYHPQMLNGKQSKELYSNCCTLSHNKTTIYNRKADILCPERKAARINRSSPPAMHPRSQRSRKLLLPSLQKLLPSPPTSIL